MVCLGRRTRVAPEPCRQGTSECARSHIFAALDAVNRCESSCAARLTDFGERHGKMEQGEQDCLHARDSVGQTSSATQPCLNPGFSERISNSRPTGPPADEIGAIAAEHHVGLIVMGLVGTSGPLGTRPGTVAYRVLCLATASVLALPSRTDASI